MRIPSRQKAGFCKEIIDDCSASLKDRIQRGAMYRNIYLTGDQNGDPQMYPKTFAYIDNLSSYLYSPVELRFNIEQYGYASAADSAMCHSAASELHRKMRQGGVDTKMEGAVTWSLVKGKSFVKLLWGDDGFEPYIVQPELMGVLREDIDSLDRQEAFFHSTYYTPDRFKELVRIHPDKEAILRKVKKFLSASAEDSPNRDNSIKQVILGGMNPYQAASNNSTKNKGIVDWLGGPAPYLSAQLLKSLIRVDELWIWDDARDDYTTVQIVDDVIIYGNDRHTNIFADMFDPDNKEKNTPTDKDNPLSGHHPFIEICPNELDGYFWGRSEICNVAMLQNGMNVRIKGIGDIMRRQEDPPRLFSGSSAITQRQYSAVKKPGGYLTDSNPNAKMTSLAPEMPAHIFESLHEYERMFDEMAGFSPTMQGRGDSGVRAGGHAETLTRNSSPRFKDRALIVERQVEALGGLALDMLKAKVGTEQVAWVDKKHLGIWEKINPAGWFDEIKGMKPIPYLFSQLPDNSKVVVDSHSSSPAFSHDTRELLFSLFKAGAVKPEKLVEHTNPPGEDSMIQDIKEAEIAKAEFAAAHPEEAAKSSGKKKK